jgi:UDP-N-acetylglucosamine 2-epimerase (non-hydrolysing)
MSDVFFQELGLPEPDVNLEVGSGSHARQTAEIMARLEPVIVEQKPDLVVVYGDVNSTVAAALVCSKLLVPLGHVEAGLRSFDRTMPEEINRLLTDQVADLLFTPSSDGDENLLHEGIAPAKIHLVGNVMIDTLIRLLPVAERRYVLERLYVKPRAYGLVTLHRPANVDDPSVLGAIVEALHAVSNHVSLLFPVHPRTRQRLQHWELAEARPGVRLLEPLSYLDFLALQRSAAFVITDSGGIQEESTYLGVPCLTVRENTERPITTRLGTSCLVGRDMRKLQECVQQILTGDWRHGQIPPLWDGHAAERIADVIVR